MTIKIEDLAGGAVLGIAGLIFGGLVFWQIIGGV